MFSTRTTSQEPTTTSSGETTNNVVPPVSDPVVPVSPQDGNTGATGTVPPDCPATFVPMQLVIIPELDLTVCKPKIKITNKAVCVPNCECEGCT